MGVVLEVPAKGGAVPIWVDLEHPRLRPDAAILAVCDRARVLIRATQTRRQIAAELTEAQQRRYLDQAAMMSLDLDARDERVVEALTRYSVRFRESPVVYMNRLLKYAVPEGYRPVRPVPALTAGVADWAPIQYADQRPTWLLAHDEDSKPLLRVHDPDYYPPPWATGAPIEWPDEPPF